MGPISPGCIGIAPDSIIEHPPIMPGPILPSDQPSRCQPYPFEDRPNTTPAKKITATTNTTPATMTTHAAA
jgi:hypothetical protein